MDTTYIHGLEIETKIGIYDWERANKQKLIIDLDIGTNFNNSIVSDSIEDCIDYVDIYKQINILAKEHSYELLESFAQRISELVLKHSKSSWVKIKINKPMAIKEAKSTGVIIERFKNEENHPIT